MVSIQNIISLAEQHEYILDKQEISVRRIEKTYNGKLPKYQILWIHELLCENASHQISFVWPEISLKLSLHESLVCTLYFCLYLSSHNIYYVKLTIK